MKHSKTGLLMRGAAMGIAEVIPGVSGGTIAFITGIYQQLLNSIKAIDPELIKLLFQFKFAEVWKKLNGNFLLWLFGGMVGGILVGVFGVSYFLIHYPEVLWSLFFGLILASVPLMVSQVDKQSALAIGLFVLGAVIAYGITSLTPSAGSTSYIYLYIAGVIAISALVLPGISGSFMLLLMGLYTTVIPTIKEFLRSPELSEFMLLAVFGLGCLTGLTLFSRLVSAAFENYRNATIMLLSGFMLGSLNKIWPWRNPEQILDKDLGQYINVNSENIGSIDFLADNIKIIQEQNVFPAQYLAEARTPHVVLAFALGLLIIFAIYKLDITSKKQA